MPAALTPLVGRDDEIAEVSRLVAEGLAAVEARNGGWADVLRLLAAADDVRGKTGYRWRFDCERQSTEAARAAAVQALGRQAKIVMTEAAHMDWHDVINHRRPPSTKP